jgi:hypothetical protein
MNEIIRRITGKDNGIPKNMVYADNINWKPKEKTLEAKFHRIITVCEEFELNVNLDMYMVMKIHWRTGDMQKINCNN